MIDDEYNGDVCIFGRVVINIFVLILINVHWQPNKGRGEMKELRLLCAEDEQGRTCWMTAFRLFKVTEHLHVFFYLNHIRTVVIPEQESDVLLVSNFTTDSLL